MVERLGVTEVLTRDHRAVDALFTTLEADPPTTAAQHARRGELVEQVIIELTRHTAVEEMLVYPAVARRIDPAQADQARTQHAHAERTMRRLQELQSGDPEFETELARLMSDVREHMAEEENSIFPLLRGAFDQDELVKLGTRVERARKVAPTRPHPAVPHHGPERKLLGPMVGMLDRLRDAVAKRGTQR